MPRHPPAKGPSAISIREHGAARQVSIRVAQPRNQLLLLQPAEPGWLGGTVEGQPQVLKQDLKGDRVDLIT